MNRIKIATWSDLADREPAGALVGNVDLVVIPHDPSHGLPSCRTAGAWLGA